MTTFDQAETDLKDVPISIGLIEIKGLRKTKQDLLQPLVAPCLQATTFGALSLCLRETAERMQRLDIFKAINIGLDRMKGGPGDDVQVTLETEEKKYRLHAGTEVKRNDIAFSISGQLYNLLGRAEKLDVSASIGQNTAAPLSLALSKPIGGDPDRLLSLSAGSHSAANPGGAKYCHSSHYSNVSYRLPGYCHGTHELRWGLDWRTIYGLDPMCSPSTRRSAGHSLKSALSHTWSLDTRDDTVFPSSGRLVRIISEFAGHALGGDAQFLKQDLFCSLHMGVPKLPNVVLSGSLHAGHLSAFNGKASTILDRFRLGGPNSVRGFPVNSLGPRDQEDVLGGDLALEGGLSLSFPLAPALAHISRAHVFTNFGLLGLTSGSMKTRVSSLFETKPHASVGAGLLFKMGPSTRLELNLAMPVSPSSGSSGKLSGIQLGIGVEFL